MGQLPHLAIRDKTILSDLLPYNETHLYKIVLGVVISEEKLNLPVIHAQLKRSQIA